MIKLTEGNVKGRYAHVGESRQSFWGAVGVQSREHQVTGLSHFNGDGGGVEIFDSPTITMSGSKKARRLPKSGRLCG